MIIAEGLKIKHTRTGALETVTKIYPCEKRGCLLYQLESGEILTRPVLYRYYEEAPIA